MKGAKIFNDFVMVLDKKRIEYLWYAVIDDVRLFPLGDATQRMVKGVKS